MLVVYHPDAASADAQKLALLASAALPTSIGDHDPPRAQSPGTRGAEL